MSHTRDARVRWLLLVAAAAALAWAVIVGATGGVVLRTSVGRISSRDVWRPLIVAIAAIVVYVVRYRAGMRADLRAIASVRPSTMIAAALTAAALAISIFWGSFVAAGSDAYGYISQAEMWVHGELTTPAPEWAGEAPWQDAAWTSAPLGYRPSEVSQILVPTYAPGLPMMMGAFQAVAGRGAVYGVVPLMSAVAVLMTYLIGVQLGGPWAGVVGAVLLFTSPTFLMMAMQPLSDVPSAALWGTALWAAAGAGLRRATAAGVAAALAVLVRPNLVPLAAIVALIVAMKPGARLRDLLVFAVPLVSAAAGIAWLNAYWYGSPLRSGYGSLGTIYSIDRVWPNARNYLGWLVQAETPVILLTLAAAWVIDATRERRRVVLLTTVAFPAVILLIYLPYFVFEVWWYLRFLLPAYPAALAGAGAVIVTGARRIANPVARIAVVSVVVGGVAVHGLRYADPFAIQDTDKRYTGLATYVTQLPPRSVFVSLMYSGTIRYYTGRDVLRWELLDPASLDTAVSYLRQRGHEVYLVGERFELDDFRRRFEKSATVRGLDQAQVLNLGGVMVYTLGGSLPQAVRPAVPAASTRP